MYGYGMVCCVMVMGLTGQRPPGAAAPPAGAEVKRDMVFCLAPVGGVTPEIFGQSDDRTSGRHFVLREESLLIATIVIFLVY